jgi:hypothetical protein
MNLHALTENDLAFVLPVSRKGKRLGEVAVPAHTTSSVVIGLVREAKEWLSLRPVNAQPRR